MRRSRVAVAWEWMSIATYCYAMTEHISTDATPPIALAAGHAERTTPGRAAASGRDAVAVRRSALAWERPAIAAPAVARAGIGREQASVHPAGAPGTPATAHVPAERSARCLAAASADRAGSTQGLAHATMGPASAPAGGEATRIGLAVAGVRLAIAIGLAGYQPWT